MNKKKAVIASLVLGLSISAGTAFATGDAVERLQLWYNSQFQQSQNDFNENTVKPLLVDMKNQLESYTNELMDGSKQRIEKSAQDATWSSVGSIYIHDWQYIKRVRDKSAELKPKVSSDFDSFVSEKNQEVNSEIDGEVEKILQDLNHELDSSVPNSNNSVRDSSNKAQ